MNYVGIMSKVIRVIVDRPLKKNIMFDYNFKCIFLIPLKFMQHLQYRLGPKIILVIIRIWEILKPLQTYKYTYGRIIYSKWTHLKLYFTIQKNVSVIHCKSLSPACAHSWKSI